MTELSDPLEEPLPEPLDSLPEELPDELPDWLPEDDQPDEPDELEEPQQPSPSATTSHLPLSANQIAQPKLPPAAPSSGTTPSASNTVKSQSVWHQVGLPPTLSP